MDEKILFLLISRKVNSGGMNVAFFKRNLQTVRGEGNGLTMMQQKFRLYRFFSNCKIDFKLTNFLKNDEIFFKEYIPKNGLITHILTQNDH